MERIDVLRVHIKALEFWIDAIRMTDEGLI